jgi:hypothetical protein
MWKGEDWNRKLSEAHSGVTVGPMATVMKNSEELSEVSIEDRIVNNPTGRLKPPASKRSTLGTWSRSLCLEGTLH